MSEKKQQTAYPLRMPPPLREQLEAMAARTKRSLNAEILARLEATIALDEFMEEIKVGTFADAYTLLESVLADNDQIEAHGGQTFNTAYSLLDRLLEEKLEPLRGMLSQVTSWEHRGDQPSPTTKPLARKRSRPLGMDQEEWEAKRRTEIDSTKPTE